MKNKTLFSVIFILAIVIATMPIAVLAAVVDTESTPAGIYGTLTGTLSEYGYYTTSVTQNPDLAQLTISGLFQNINGQNIGVQNNLYSARGERFFQELGIIYPRELIPCMVHMVFRVEHSLLQDMQFIR